MTLWPIADSCSAAKNRSPDHFVGLGEPLAVLCRRQIDQPSTAGFSTSSHHCRKLVGVVFSAVRGSALSRPSFLAHAMSVMPCDIASDMPRSTKPALYASNETRW